MAELFCQVGGVCYVLRHLDLIARLMLNFLFNKARFFFGPYQLFITL